MPYFMACIRETLRVSPPTPVILPLYVSEMGLVINDIWIPQKTEIAANPYIIHRSKQIFGVDADVFRPERWLEGSEIDIRLMDKYDLAWGYGSRKCMGKNLSLFESQKLCLQLFRDFEISSTRLVQTENWGVELYKNQSVTLISKT
ncbi:hypothetical protein MMC11_001364 [Xylographa trunciseda]|nr:hypothetical protein [Xylographa trunciseda]